MGIEIERKFLVTGEAYKETASPAVFRQGYLSVESGRTVRVRTYNRKGFITIKGKTDSFSRDEFEYEIPFEEAEAMLEKLCIKPLIEKTRYFLDYKGNEWVVDEFSGVNEGLVVAEIELESEEQVFDRPEWIGNEVTRDKRYANSNLVKNPYGEWCRFERP